MKVLFVVCVLNFLHFGKTLNENCTTNDDCSAQEKSVCKNQVCSCDDVSEYIEDQKKCGKYATEYGSICYSDTQCALFLGDGSTCQNNICVCGQGYRWYQGNCQKYAKKDETCSNDFPCLDPDTPLALNCSAASCQCSDSYYDRGGDCRVRSELGEDCAISYDCFPTNDAFGVPDVYSHCELGKCVKDTTLLMENDTTTHFDSGSNWKNLHDAVSMKYKDAECPNGVVSDLTEDECSRCSNTLFFLNSTCICNKGFFLKDSRCIAELGMTDSETSLYTSDSDCPIKPGKLVNKACYCKDYWFQDSTNRECIKTTLEYTENCMDDDWCKAMGEYAYCNADTKKCQCASQAVLNETSFYCNLKPDANLTGICWSGSPCPLYETCVDEQCMCTEGFYRADDSGLCLPKIGYSCEVRNCSHIESAICSNQTVCECESDEYITDGLLCLKPATALDEECVIEQQCSKIPHSACLKDSAALENGTSRCLCTDEYLKVEGTCYALKYPGSLCTTQTDCTIILGDSFVCRNMLCQCPIGKTLNQDNICSSAIRLDFDTVLAAVLSFLIILRHKIE